MSGSKDGKDSRSRRKKGGMKKQGGAWRKVLGISVAFREQGKKGLEITLVTVSAWYHRGGGRHGEYEKEMSNGYPQKGSGGSSSCRKLTLIRRAPLRECQILAKKKSALTVQRNSGLKEKRKGIVAAKAPV